jgi:hypothetical protein
MISRIMVYFFEGVIDLAVAAFVVATTAAGVYSARFPYIPMFPAISVQLDHNPLIGAAIGFFVGCLIASLVFGFVYMLIDIRRNTARMVKLLEKE